MKSSLTGKVTLSAVKSLQTGQTLRDRELKGFGVRRQSGAPSYFLQTRIKGRLRWLTIGPHGAPWTPSTARIEALRMLTEIADGRDPGQETKFARQAPTIKELVPTFMEEHGPKLKATTRTEYWRLINNDILPAFGRRKVADLARSDVAQFHSRLHATPSKANFALSVLSKMMSWAESEGLRPEDSNPCRRISRYGDVKRERYLTNEEIQHLGAVLTQAEQDDAESPYVIAAIRLLLMTGARLSEILTLKWQYIDLQRGFLFLPDSKTGRKPIFLSEPTKDLIRDIPRIAGNPYVIVGANKDAHLVNLQKPWRRIRKQAGLEDVRIHDLRHSYASIAAESGGSLPLIGRLLGHTQPQTTERYAHLAADPVRELNETIGAKLANALQGRKSG